MKKYILLVIITLSFTSCNKNDQYGIPEADPTIIQKDFMKWWEYNCNNITLSSDFKSLDENSQIISKENFLKKLTSGKYIPIQLTPRDTTVYYKLYELESNCNPDVKNVVKNESLNAYQNFKKEKKLFPEFNFTDLKGNIYNKETAKDKIIILKCWNIHCQKCIEEMPELNSLIKKYAVRKDIIFISLADDSSQKLTEFLLKKEFNYAVVPHQKLFIRNTLNISTYPTHIIINKKGLISKEVTNFKELAMALEKETSK
jgi:thiol-disulfide isomerase/thioredoxin